MPSAERRAKKKLAIAKAKAALAEANATRTNDMPSCSDPTRTWRTVACQTELEAGAVKQIIEQYWRRLDTHKRDQAREPWQFIISSASGLRTTLVAQDETQHSTGEEENQEKEEEEEEEEKNIGRTTMMTRRLRACST